MAFGGFKAKNPPVSDRRVLPKPCGRKLERKRCSWGSLEASKSPGSGTRPAAAAAEWNHAAISELLDLHSDGIAVTWPNGLNALEAQRLLDNGRKCPNGSWPQPATSVHASSPDNDAAQLAAHSKVIVLPATYAANAPQEPAIAPSWDRDNVSDLVEMHYSGSKVTWPTGLDLRTAEQLLECDDSPCASENSVRYPYSDIVFSEREFSDDDNDQFFEPQRSDELCPQVALPLPVAGSMSGAARGASADRDSCSFACSSAQAWSAGMHARAGHPHRSVAVGYATVRASTAPGTLTSDCDDQKAVALPDIATPGETSTTPTVTEGSGSGR